MTSASVISATRFHFVRPFSGTVRPSGSRRRGLPSGPTTTRVIRCALIAAGPPCRDQASHLTAEGVHHEEHLTTNLADDLPSLLRRTLAAGRPSRREAGQQRPPGHPRSRPANPIYGIPVGCVNAPSIEPEAIKASMSS